MITKVRTHLARELEQLSHELLVRMRAQQEFARTDRNDELDSQVRRILQRRIRFLGQLVAGLGSVAPAIIWHDRVGYGSLVLVREPASDSIYMHTLLAADLIEVEEGEISLDSPLGRALLGRRPGERIRVEDPTGERNLELIAMVTLPQRLNRAERSARLSPIEW